MPNSEFMVISSCWILLLSKVVSWMPPARLMDKRSTLEVKKPISEPADTVVPRLTVMYGFDNRPASVPKVAPSVKSAFTNLAA